MTFGWSLGTLSKSFKPKYTITHVINPAHPFQPKRIRKTCKVTLNIQAHVKAYLSKVMDVPGCLTSKHNQNLDTSNKHHSKQF